VNLEPGVFCSDMTELIAAASHCRKPGSPRELDLVHRVDPMADSAFEYVCTVVCNYTAVFFHRPKELVLADPVIRAWAAAADEPAVMAVVSTADSSTRHVDDAEHNRLMANAFVTWVVDDRYAIVKRLNNAQLLARFVHFQLSHEDLMFQFWNNNRDQDMRRAFAALKSAFPSNDLGGLSEAIKGEGIGIDSVSMRRWGKEDAEDFPMAYGYWGFFKGFQYVLDLPKDPIYVCHWLREDACLQGVKVSNVRDDPRFRALFPWGVLLNELVRYPTVSEEEEEFFNVLRRLRSYTRDNLHQMRPSSSESWTELESLRQATIDFLAGALKHAMPQEWERYIQVMPVVNKILAGPVARFLGLGSSWDSMKRATELAIQHLPELQESISGENLLQRKVRIRRYRQTAEEFIHAHRYVFESFWKERGWSPS